MALFHSYIQKIEKNKSHYLETHAAKVKLFLQCKEMIISGEKGSDFFYWKELWETASGVLAMFYFLF